jgi:hypothetical protein
MTRTDSILASLAREEVFAWAREARSISDRVDEMFLGNAQGGEADLDDYEVCQMMAEGF